jgi:hypothetical protein
MKKTLFLILNCLFTLGVLAQGPHGVYSFDKELTKHYIEIDLAGPEFLMLSDSQMKAMIDTVTHNAAVASSTTYFFFKGPYCTLRYENYQDKYKYGIAYDDKLLLFGTPNDLIIKYNYFTDVLVMEVNAEGVPLRIAFSSDEKKEAIEREKNKRYIE